VERTGLQFVNVRGNHSFQLKHVLHSSSHHFLIIQFPHILTLVHSFVPSIVGLHHPYTILTHFALTSQALLAIENIDVNLSDDSGATPLLMASENGHLLVVQVNK
jgi:hypothetical protein